MQLSRYIKKLLPEHETVIFPGLGAFITTYKPASINEESTEILPPSRTISFEPKIRHNDGLLAEVMAENEHITPAEALKRLEREREEILYRLDKGEEVALGNLGILFHSETGKISFKPSGAHNFLADAFGLEKTMLKEEKPGIPADKYAAGQSSVTNHTGDATDKEENGSEKVEQESASAIMIHSDEHPPKRRRRWPWLILFVIPIAAAAVFLLIRQQKKAPVSMDITVETTGKAKNRDESAGITPDEGLAEDEGKRAVEKEKSPGIAHEETEADSVSAAGTNTFAETEKSEIDSSTAGYIAADTTKFYVIGGSFEEAKNAEKYFQKMKQEGYEPYHLGKKGNFYLVGIEIYDNEIEAYGAQYNFLDKHPDSGVWVYIPE